VALNLSHNLILVTIDQVWKPAFKMAMVNLHEIMPVDQIFMNECHYGITANDFLQQLSICERASYSSCPACFCFPIQYHPQQLLAFVKHMAYYLRQLSFKPLPFALKFSTSLTCLKESTEYPLALKSLNSLIIDSLRLAIVVLSL
jgi:hypothetical protein